MLDFNHGTMRTKDVDGAVNGLVDAALVSEALTRPARGYLGASSLGHECLRRIQLDWLHPDTPPGRIQRIFARGHWAEDLAARALRDAGFDIRRTGDGLVFRQAGERFRGHIDGRIESGPPIKGLAYPCLWECKCLNAAGYRKIGREGLAKARPEYAAQVALYQAYLALSANPALFTVINADTMEMQHFLVPFDAELAQAASDRAVTVLRITDAGEEAPKIAGDGEDFRCRMCGHRERCWA